MTRILAIALGVLFIGSLLFYGCDQYEGVQERESEALHKLATLQAKQGVLERTIQIREDSLVVVTIRAERAEAAAARLRKRADFLLAALDQPTPPFNGSDSTLAAAMAAQYRHR